MSRINFETKSKTIGVHGSERFYANSLMVEITDTMLDAKNNQQLLLSAIDKESL